MWPCIIYISKEDVPTWCKQCYYDFILINGLYMFRTFTCPSSGVLIYRLFHCRMWCYALGVVAVVLRSWCVVLCTICQLVSIYENKIIVTLFASSWYIFLTREASQCVPTEVSPSHISCTRKVIIIPNMASKISYMSSQRMNEWKNGIWVRGLSGLMHLGLRTGPLCPIFCYKIRGVPSLWQISRWPLY